VRIFAAASLTDALTRLEPDYERICECGLTLVFAGSGTLARQIHAGARVDLLISADERWITWLDNKNMAFAQKGIVVENTLVMASASTDIPLEPQDFIQNRFVMGEPYSVPVGTYGRSALTELGVWQKAQSNAIFAENARIATAMIRRGDVKFGLVYQSDAVAARLNVANILHHGLTGPIRYEAMAFNGTGARVLKWLGSPRAQGVFEELGFKNPGSK